jgi:IS605 OrfB family transposase
MSQPLKIRWSRYFTGEPKSVTISKDPSNRYFVSFLVEEELDGWDRTDGKIGVDLGVKDVIVTSTGFASGNPKHYQKYQARLKTLQRRLAKKKKGSNNRQAARLKVAKLHAKIADCRKDFLHKLTTQLVRENQAIYTETLAVKNMMANRKLAKAIADCGWSEALRQFQYKCKWHDRKLGAIDRWFPSSKRCNPCGHILDKLPLDIREWICPSCKSLNLRDKNAALNIAFIPHGSLGAHPLKQGAPLANAEGIIADIAVKKGVKPNQIALAWLLHRAPDIIIIPGTTIIDHLEENMAASSTTLLLLAKKCDRFNRLNGELYLIQSN